MSSLVQDWDCTQCKEGKGFNETFNDTEDGYILECNSCNYMEVYREDVETGNIIENYSGYNHYYNNKLTKKESK